MCVKPQSGLSLFYATSGFLKSQGLNPFFSFHFCKWNHLQFTSGTCYLMKSDCGSSCKVKNAFVIKINSFCLINFINSDLVLLEFLSQSILRVLPPFLYVHCFHLMLFFPFSAKIQRSISVPRVHTLHNMKGQHWCCSFIQLECVPWHVRHPG